MTRALLTLACVSLLAGCADAPPVVTPRADVAASMAAAARPAGAGLVRRLIPAEDPGPPFYARVGLQILESDGYVAIPFYRSPALVPAAFNLLTFYDFPGPSGPGAFAAPLLPTGFLLTEADAPLGTFPRQVELRGAGVPIWFVPSTAFHAAAQDGVLTIAELRSLGPLYGTAAQYHETLHPREGEHKIVITARGTLADGRRFELQVTHVGDALRHMRIAFR
jgi:hypothetical protein